MPAIRPLFSERLRTDWRSPAGAAGRCSCCHGGNLADGKAAARTAGQQEQYIAKAPLDDKSAVRSGGGVTAMAQVACSPSDSEIPALAHDLARA
jgi:cytochrome c553